MTKLVKMTMKTIALIECGCFNPPTFLHLRLFETARDALTKAGFSVPVGIISPAHDAYGKKGLLPAVHRINMCQLAVKSSDWITCEVWETEQEGWTRTSNVLDHYHTLLDRKYPGISLRLICGADLLESFNIPNLWSDEHIRNICCRHGIVCMERKGYDAENFARTHPIVSEEPQNVFIFQPDVENNISSTLIRDLASNGRSLKYLIPDDVISYIKQHKLYLNI